MPRALAELRRALPDVTLYPVPVLPPGLRASRGLVMALRLLAEEYTKYLAGSAGPDGTVPGACGRSLARHGARPDDRPALGAVQRCSSSASPSC